MSLTTTAKVRIAAAVTAIGLAGTVVACGDSYRNCPDWECGQGLYYAPYIIPVIGVYGQPGYVPAQTIQPGAPGYRPTYVGKPPNFTPPSGAKINPSGQKPPPNYKPPTGATLTVQKAPKPSGNTVPGGSSKPSSGSGGSKQTVQKAPSAPKPASKPSSGGKK